MFQFDARLFGIAFCNVRLKPRSSTERAVAGKIWRRRQVTTVNFRGLLHPPQVVFDALTYLRPSAFDVSRLRSP